VYTAPTYNAAGTQGVNLVFRNRAPRLVWSRVNTWHLGPYWPQAYSWPPRLYILEMAPSLAAAWILNIYDYDSSCWFYGHSLWVDWVYLVSSSHTTSVSPERLHHASIMNNITAACTTQPAMHVSHFISQ